MPSINPDRLLADLRTLRSIGAQGPGVVRPAFSATDMEARRWLQKRYEEAGLVATIDGVGNVFGRSRARGKAVLIGSHSDTQPTGGKYYTEVVSSGGGAWCKVDDKVAGVAPFLCKDLNGGVAH